MRNVLFLILLIFVSCQDHKIGDVIYDVAIDVVLKNSNGENLLAEQTADHIDFESINVSYLLEGDVQTVYNSNLDCPKNICLINDPGQPVGVRIYLNDALGDAYPVTYIDWGNGDIDTLKSHFVRKNDGAYVVSDSVWFNNGLMYPNQTSSGLGRAIEVVK